MNPSMNDLRYFLAVARFRSFTRAAEALLISQPSLSRAIADLERGFETTFFTRTTRAVELTDEGHEFQSTAHDIVNSYDNALGRFAAFRAGERGTVTIAALPSLAAGRLPGLLAAFLASHPQVNVNVRERMSSDLLHDVRNGHADLAISDFTDDSEDVTPFALSEDEMKAVIPKESELARLSALTWKDLARSSFIAIRDGSSVRRMTDSGFSTANISPDRVREVESVAAAGAYIATGLGVTAIPASALHLMNLSNVHIRDLHDPVIRRTITLYQRRRPRLSAAAADLAATIRQQWTP
jgi:DNA-binding transcriptional LysR family regulator